MTHIPATPVAQDGQSPALAAPLTAYPRASPGPFIDAEDPNLSGTHRPHPDDMVAPPIRVHKYYAINIGLKVGIADNWTLANSLTKGLTGSPEGFATWELAHGCYADAYYAGLVTILTGSRAQSPHSPRSPRSPRHFSPFATGDPSAFVASPAPPGNPAQIDSPAFTSPIRLPAAAGDVQVLRFHDATAPALPTLSGQEVQVMRFVHATPFVPVASATPAAPAIAATPAAPAVPDSPEIQFIKYVRAPRAGAKNNATPSTPTPAPKRTLHASEPLSVISPSFAYDSVPARDGNKGKGPTAAPRTRTVELPALDETSVLDLSDYEHVPELLLVRKKARPAPPSMASTAPTSKASTAPASKANTAPASKARPAPASKASTAPAPAADVTTAPPSSTTPLMTLALAEAIFEGTQAPKPHMIRALAAAYINGHSQELSRRNGEINRRPGSTAYLSGDRPAGKKDPFATFSAAVASSSKASASSSKASANATAGPSKPSSAATRVRPRDIPPRRSPIELDSDDYDANGFDFTDPNTLEEIDVAFGAPMDI